MPPMDPSEPVGGSPRTGAPEVEVPEAPSSRAVTGQAPAGRAAAGHGHGDGQAGLDEDQVAPPPVERDLVTPPSDQGVDSGSSEPDGGLADRDASAAEEVTVDDEVVAAEDLDEDRDELSVATRQRDDYLDALRRLQADFENYKKRVVKQQADIGERAAQSLVEQLLPALDNADLALAHGAGEGIKKIWDGFNDALSKAGLERIDTAGDPFDPNQHDAVAHEPGDGAQEVAEVMRAGYRWKGRVIRAAMVKVRG